MKIRVESKEIFESISSYLTVNDVLIIHTVKILGDSKEQAIKRYMQLFDNGIIVLSVGEPYINPRFY